MKDKKYFCPMPWVNLTVSAKGSFNPCWMYESDIKTNSFDEAQNKIFQPIRDDIENDIRNPGCKNCWFAEDHGQISFRQQMIEALKGMEINLNTSTPKRLDIKLTNACNLKCRMCHPYASNQIEKEFDHLKTKHPNFQYFSSFDEITTNDGKRDILEQLKEYAPTLERIYATGGEPLFNSYFIKFLKYCIDLGISKNIILSMNTNATIITEEWMSIFRQFKKLSFVVSVDGVGNIFEYIRYPAKWSTLNENIKILQNEFDTQLAICIVPQVYNILDITNIFEWARSTKIHNESVEIMPPWLIEPEFLHIKNMPINLKQKALDIFDSYKPQTQFEKMFIEGVRIDINRRRDTESWNEFLEYTKILDTNRQQDMKKSIPNLSKLIKFE